MRCAALIILFLIRGAISSNLKSIFIFTLIEPDKDYNVIANLVRIGQHLMQLSPSEWSNGVRSVYLSKTSCKNMKKHDVDAISVELGIKLICTDLRQYKDSRIGTHQRAQEHVSTILHSMSDSIEGLSSSNTKGVTVRILYLAISGTSTFIPSSKFYENWNGKYFGEESRDFKLFNILLYGKNKKMGVVSDWHDLQCVAIRYTSASDYATISGWMKVLKSTYEEYADRAEFNMLEPRPAIIEANIQYKQLLTIKYWSRMFIHTGLSALPPTTLLTLNCHSSHAPPVRRFGDPFEDFDKDICENIYDVGVWRRNIDLYSGRIGHVLGVPEDGLDTRLPWGIDNGALRFRLADINAK